MKATKACLQCPRMQKMASRYSKFSGEAFHGSLRREPALKSHSNPFLNLGSTVRALLTIRARGPPAVNLKHTRNSTQYICDRDSPVIELSALKSPSAWI